MSDDSDYVDYLPPDQAQMLPDPEPEMPPITPEWLDRNAIRKQARHPLLDKNQQVIRTGVDLAGVPDDRLDGLLLTCRGDVDLAVHAATQDPRPAWVTLHIGRRKPATPTTMDR